ncbi:MAG: hypothetical protein JWN04_4207 [Myxococcaceae bacterium]|nr:hypothetical protein [Myxococcaceae bacterium]
MTTLAPNALQNKLRTVAEASASENAALAHIGLARDVLALHRAGTFGAWEQSFLGPWLKKNAGRPQRSLLAIHAADHVAHMEKIRGAGRLMSLLYVQSSKAFPGVEDAYFNALLADSPKARAAWARRETGLAAIEAELAVREAEQKAASDAEGRARAEQLHQLSVAAGGSVVRIAGNRNGRNLTLAREQTRARRWVWGGEYGGHEAFEAAEIRSEVSGGEIPPPRHADYGREVITSKESLAIDWPRVRRSLELAREVFVESGDVGPDIVVAPKWLVSAEAGQLARLVDEVFGLQDIDVYGYMHFGGTYRANTMEPHATVMGVRASSRVLTLFDPLTSSDSYETSMEGARVELWTIRSELARDLPGAPRLHVHVGDVSLEGERLIERVIGRPKNSSVDGAALVEAAKAKLGSYRAVASALGEKTDRGVRRWAANKRQPSPEQCDRLRALAPDPALRTSVPDAPTPTAVGCSPDCDCLECALRAARR